MNSALCSKWEEMKESNLSRWKTRPEISPKEKASQQQYFPECVWPQHTVGQSSSVAPSRAAGIKNKQTLLWFLGQGMHEVARFFSERKGGKEGIWKKRREGGKEEEIYEVNAGNEVRGYISSLGLP